MAQILVRMNTNTKVPKLKFKGAPLVAMPDDHKWSTKEKLPYFLVIKVDIPLSEAAALCGIANTAEQEPIRKYGFDVDSKMTTQEIKDLEESKEFTPPVIEKKDIEETVDYIAIKK